MPMYVQTLLLKLSLEIHHVHLPLFGVFYVRVSLQITFFSTLSSTILMEAAGNFRLGAVFPLNVPAGLDVLVQSPLERGKGGKGALINTIRRL